MAVLGGAKRQLSGGPVAGHVARGAAEDRSDAVEHRERGVWRPWMGGVLTAAARPSTRGACASAPASRESEAASSTMCMPANDVPQAKIRRASMSGWAAAPADHGAVVLALTGDGELLARLAGRAAKVAVVEGDCGEALAAEPLGKRRQSAGLDPADAVSHHDRGVRSVAFGPVQPGFDLVARCGRDADGRAGRCGDVVRAGHGVNRDPIDSIMQRRERIRVDRQRL